MRNQCDSCTCLPGLLSRNNRRVSLMAKRITRERTPHLGLSASRKASVFSIDPALLCLPETKEINTLARLAALRKLMAKLDLAIYIVPSTDPHASEYVALAHQRRAFISGFSGSLATAIVSRDMSCMNDEPLGQAALATDSRYYAQATAELDFNWTLVKEKPTLSWHQWLVGHAIDLARDLGLSSIRVGVDPTVLPHSDYLKLVECVDNNIKDKSLEIVIVPVADNLVDLIWPQFEEPIDRSLTAEIVALDSQYSGQGLLEKLAVVLAAAFGLDSPVQAADAMVVSALDDIAWLLNLRGSDIEYNPVFFSYMILTKEHGHTLFIDPNRLSPNIVASLNANNIKIEPYLDFFEKLRSLASSSNMHVILPKTVNWEAVRQVPLHTLVPSLIQNIKLIKNKTELEGARRAHQADGFALVSFFAWLLEQLTVHNEFVDEVSAAEKLAEIRAADSLYRGPSFNTISASGANAAIVHYAPVRGSCAYINPTKLYLNDSGGQYVDGTTDTTRTLHFGSPSPQEANHYTLVLKGHIALASARFPRGTTGSLLDPLARQYLWRAGLDYGHGTGHGVGSFLNVHEGPVSVLSRSSLTALEPGHLLSNEPGYYQDGHYGIRLENVMFVKDSGFRFNDVSFLEFETITLVPFCKALINTAMLDDRDIVWLNNYHLRVWQEHSKRLDQGSYAYKWLKRETSPVKKCAPPLR